MANDPHADPCTPKERAWVEAAAARVIAEMNRAPPSTWPADEKFPPYRGPGLRPGPKPQRSGT